MNINESIDSQTPIPKRRQIYEDDGSKWVNAENFISRGSTTGLLS